MSKAEELESLMAVLSIKEQRIKELESQVGSIREQVSLLSAAVAPTTKKLHNPVEIDKHANIRVQVNPGPLVLQNTRVVSEPFVVKPKNITLSTSASTRRCLLAILKYDT